MNRTLAQSRATRLSACVALLALASATPAAAADVWSEPWRWTTFTHKEGVPPGRVLDLVEAEDGDLWIHTDFGVARFDGFRWRAATGGVPRGTEVTQILAARGGGVLVVADGRLYRSDDSLRLVPFEPAPPKIRWMVARGAGEELWLRSPPDFYRFDDGEWKQAPRPPETDEGTAVLRPTRTSVPFAVAGGFTYHWDGVSWTRVAPFAATHVELTDFGGVLSAVYSPFAGLWELEAPNAEPQHLDAGLNTYVTAVAVAQSGDAVATYGSGRVRVRTEGSWRWLNDRPEALANPRFLKFQKNGDLWVGDDRGLSWLRRSLDRWTRWSAGQAPDETATSDQSNALLVARNGDLWVGTSDGLVIHRKDGAVDHVRALDGVQAPIITGIAQADGGSIWVGSGATFSGAFRYDGSQWTRAGSEQGLDAPRVHRIVALSDGSLWFLGLGVTYHDPGPGAFRYDGRSFERVGVEEGLLDGRVYDLAEGTRGELWFATAGGLSRLEGGQWRHWTKAEGLQSPRIFTLECDQEGRAWFAHQSRNLGLGSIDADGEIRYYGVDDGLVDDRIRELDVAPDGSIWIATESGLGRLADGIFASFEVPVGLDFPSVWPMLADDSGVYVGTHGGGVYRLSLAEMTNAPPLVELEAGLHGGGDAVFRWQVFPYQAEMPSDVAETRYRLDDGPWSRWSTDREHVLSSLPSGRHVFEVQSKNLFGKASSDNASETVDVPPPLFLRPAFLVAAAMFVSTLVLGIGYMRRRRALRGVIRESESRLRALVERIPVALVELDTDGRVTSLNERARRAFEGSGGRNPVGLGFEECVAAEDAPVIRSAVASAVKGTDSEFMFSAPFRDGARHFVARLARVEDEDATKNKLLLCSQDITDARRTEDENRELAKQLRLAQKMEAVGLLAGGVAHDFNNLLTVIGGHASFVEKNPTSASLVTDSVREIKKAQQRAGALTRQLLAFGRRQVMRPEVLHLNDVISPMEEMIRRPLGEAIEVIVDLVEEPLHVRVDPSQIEQIVMNLVVNARDAMPGGGTLTLSTRSAVFDAPYSTGRVTIEPGHFARLSVRDTGVGMNEQTLGRIFEPFFSTKPLERGSGLGLATVYGITHQSGGQVAVESSPGVGTTFSIYLPVVAEESPHALESPAADRPRGGDETVLVTEDDVAILDILREILEGFGYTVLTAQTGEQALRAWQRHHGPIHLLLADLILPGIDGRELARRFRAQFKEGVVVFISGYERSAGLPDDEASDFIPKPFRPETLAARVRQALDDRPVRPSARDAAVSE